MVTIAVWRGWEYFRVHILGGGCWLQRLQAPQHCTHTPPTIVPGTQEAAPLPLPRSDLRQMLATKSVENIQFLPFLTTDVKYSGVEPGEGCVLCNWWGLHGGGGEQKAQQ